MSEFSPKFEQYVQGVERRAKPKRRVRIRKIECVMPDCEKEVRRSGNYPLCTHHLLDVWHFVDGDHAIHDRPSPYSREEPWHPGETVRGTITVEEQEAQKLAKRHKAREMAITKGHLYVLDTRDGFVKIGWTGRDLWQRLNQYPPRFRLIVAIPGTRADERDTHRSLKLALAVGREWYNVTPEVVRLINQWISIANTKRTQRAANYRREAEIEADEPGPRMPWLDARLNQQAEMIPRFVSIEDWSSKQESFKRTGTEASGVFRA